MPKKQRDVLGREEDLAKLRAGLEQEGEAAIFNSGAVLQGHGGIGKTTLARFYVERFGADYGGIFWEVVDSTEKLAEQLKVLAQPLGVSLEHLELMPAAKAVVAAIGQDKRKWLMVYDNVDHYATIRDLIPDCHLIVTTRDSTGWDGFARVAADVLDFDTEDGAAVAVLMEAAERTEDKAGARALGGLPLALVIAGRMIRSEGFAFETYLERVEDVIAQEPGGMGYPTSVMGAVKLSYDVLPEDAKAVAGVLAHWAAEGLTLDLLTGAPEGEHWESDKQALSEEMIALVSDAGRVRAAFQALVEASLLTREGDADGAHGMHRMSAAALRGLQADDSAARAAVALLAAVYPHNAQESGSFDTCRVLTPHVRTLWESGAAPEGDSTEWLLNQTGGVLLAMGDPAGGLALAEARFELGSKRLGPEHRNYATSLHNLAKARQRAGDLAGAAEAMGRAVALDEEHRPATGDLAVSYDEMGGIALSRAQAGEADQLEAAVKWSQKGLALRRRVFGQGSAELAMSLNNLGNVRSAQGRKAAAARLYGAALRIWRAVLSEGDGRIATSAMNVGASWLEAGRANLAEPLLQEALETREAIYHSEPEHPQLRIAAGWLVSCLLVRAAARENVGSKRMEATRLTAAYGFERDEAVVAALFPYAGAGPDSAGA